jgi:hypothetical protein
MPKVDKTSKQFLRGVKDEYKEHPWVGKKGAVRIVTEHLKKHPFMYLK